MDNIPNNIDQQFLSIGVNAVITYYEALYILACNYKNNIIKNNDSIINDYENYQKAQTAVERYNANEYIINNFHFNQCIFICMLGKTGDNTLRSTFIKYNISHHLILHQPLAINKTLINNIDKTIKIITAIREPISQYISGFYEWLAAPYFTNVICTEKIYKEDSILFKDGGNVQAIFDEKLANFTQTGTTSFMEKFAENAVDLSKHPFDTDKGYSIIKEGNIEVFVYQLERMNDIVAEISNWVGEKSFSEWERSNEASGKWVSDSYKQAQKELKFPQEFFDSMYNDPWIQHFYSQEDISKFKEKWHGQIK